MMDFHCSEIADNEISARVDKTLLDDRVLENLKDTENKCTQIYMGSRSREVVQMEVTPQMRAIVSEWMMEVCEEQNCQVEVFLLAMNYLNRFLLLTNIRKNQLQLSGAACMLLASKFREPKPLTIDLLVYYTDHSITKNMLASWELLVLSKLQWNIAAIVPVDFLPHLLTRLPVESVGVSEEMVKNHSKILITLWAREVDFRYDPSVVACAAIASALCGLGWTAKAHANLDSLLERLQDISSIDKDIISECLVQIEKMVQRSADTSERMKNNSNEEEICEGDLLRAEQFTPPPGKIYVLETISTPTDVCDVASRL